MRGKVRHCLPMLALVCASEALASPRMAVVADGACDDVELITNARALSKAIAARAGPTVLSVEELQRRVGRGAPADREAVERRLDAAYALFYRAEPQKADEAARSVLDELEGIEPGEARRKLFVGATLLVALVQRGARKTAESDALFERVLKLEPSHQLDADFFAPSVRTAFEKLRQKVTGLPKHAFSVVSTPPDADVFVDGKRVGKTPLLGQLPPGSYEVQLGKGGPRSFARSVKVDGDVRLVIDFAFEQAVAPQGTPCVLAKGDDASRMKDAVKLGGLLQVEDVVLVRLSRGQNGGPSWLNASLISVSTAQRHRDGGLKVATVGLPPEGLEELAAFILTGESGGRVVAGSGAAREGKGAAPTGGPALAVAAKAPTELVAPTGASAPSPAASAPMSPRSKVGIGVMALGGAAAGAGGFFLFRSGADSAAVNGFYEGGRAPSPAELPQVTALTESSAKSQTLALVMFAAGAVAGGAGAFLFFGDSADATTVAPVGTPGGAAVTLTGNF